MTFRKNILLACAFLTFATAARADAIITGSTASGDTFSIDAVTTPYAPGIVSIIGATGTATIGGVANTITGVELPSSPGAVTISSSGFFTFDDLLYASPATAFDYYGGLFTLSNGGDLELNLFYNNSNDSTSGLFYNNNGYNSPISSISVIYTVIPRIAATPEPSSLFLLGTGILGGVGAMRRRFKA